MGETGVADIAKRSDGLYSQVAIEWAGCPLRNANMTHENFNSRPGSHEREQALPDRLFADSQLADPQILAYIATGVTRLDARSLSDGTAYGGSDTVERASCSRGGRQVSHPGANHFNFRSQANNPFVHRSYSGCDSGGNQLLNNLARVGIGYALNRALGHGGCAPSYSPYDRSNRYNLDRNGGCAPSYSPYDRSNRYNLDRNGGCAPSYSPYDRSNRYNLDRNGGCDSSYSPYDRSNRYNLDRNGGCAPSYSPYDRSNRYNLDRNGGCDSDEGYSQYLRDHYRGNSGLIPTYDTNRRYNLNENDCSEDPCSCTGCTCPNCSRQTDNAGGTYRDLSGQERQIADSAATDSSYDYYGNWRDVPSSNAADYLAPRYRFGPGNQDYDNGCPQSNGQYTYRERNSSNGRYDPGNQAQQYRRQWWNGRENRQDYQRNDCGESSGQYRRQWQERGSAQPLLHQLQRATHGIIRF